MAATYEPITTTTLSSTASEVTFSNIPGTYTDLVLVFSYTYSSTFTGKRYVVLQVGNGSIDTSSSYSVVAIEGNGTTASSSVGANATFLNPYLTVKSGEGANAIMHFMNYSNTNYNKTILSRANSPQESLAANVLTYKNTVAINTIKIYDTGANTWATGSTFTLYGIKAI